MNMQGLRSVLLSEVLAPCMWDSRVHQGPGPGRQGEPGAKKKRKKKRKPENKILWGQNGEESKVQMDLITYCPHRLSFTGPCQPSRVALQVNMCVCMCVCVLRVHVDLFRKWPFLFHFSCSITNVRYQLYIWISQLERVRVHFILKCILFLTLFLILLHCHSASWLHFSYQVYCKIATHLRCTQMAQTAHNNQLEARKAGMLTAHNLDCACGASLLSSWQCFI